MHTTSPHIYTHTRWNKYCFQKRIESRLTGLEVLGVEGLTKKEKRERIHGYKQQYGDCRGKEVGGGGRGYEDINGAGKNSLNLKEITISGK